jgi:serine protease Do
MQVDDLSEELRLQAGIAEDSGVVVIEIEPGGSAEGAGIQAGDVIKEVNRTAVKDLSDYQAALKLAKKGVPLLLLLKRGKQALYASPEVP